MLVEQHSPEELLKRFAFELPEGPGGKDAVLDLVARVLKYSVNTWDQGFLDKLYATNTPVRHPPCHGLCLWANQSRSASYRTCSSQFSTRM